MKEGACVEALSGKYGRLCDALHRRKWALRDDAATAGFHLKGALFAFDWHRAALFPAVRPPLDQASLPTPGNGAGESQEVDWR